MNEGCLGLSFLDNCTYSPNQLEWNLLSIGDVIGAFSLMLAFSQLLSLTKKEKIPKKSSFVLFGFAILCSTVSIVLPFIPGTALPILGFPIAWEILSAFLIIALIIWLLLSAYMPLTFTKKTSLETLRIAHKIIGKGTERDYAELAEDLIPAIPGILRILKKYDHKEKLQSEKQNIEYKVDVEVEDAFALIQILSDPLFCAQVARKEPDFIVTLFRQIVLLDVNSDHLAPLLREIFKQSLINNDSIYIREKDASGPGAAKAVTTSLLISYKLIEDCNLMYSWSPSAEVPTSIEEIRNFNEFYLRFLSLYLKEGRIWEESSSLRRLDKITGYPENLIRRVDELPSEKVYASYPYKVLNAACDLAEEVIREIITAKTQLEFLSLQKDKQGTRIVHDNSIYRIAAKWTLDLVIAASHTRKHDFVLRSALISLWQEIYQPNDDCTQGHKLIQRHIEKEIFKKLRINLEDGMYPAVSRVIICLLGVWPPTMACSDLRFRVRFLCYLQSHFGALYLKDKQLALDKLPSDVAYDPVRGVLIQSRGNWGSCELKIWDMKFMPSTKSRLTPRHFIVEVQPFPVDFYCLN